MEIIRQNINMSDDEDDLESLRMAALQTLKKPVANNKTTIVESLPAISHRNKFNNSSPKHKRGRGFHSGPGRGGRNGQFNGRTRNTNLISVTIEQPPDENTVMKSTKGDNLQPPPKLVLPQDRYNGKIQEEIKNKEATSKFSRYDNSDNSESDELSESEHSDGEAVGKLERSNSLEALILELDYEISGEKPKSQKNKMKRRKNKGSESEKEELKSNDEIEAASTSENIVLSTPLLAPETVSNIENNLCQGDVVICTPDTHIEAHKTAIEGNKSPNYIHRSRSPIYRKKSPLNGGRHHPKKFHNRDNFTPQNAQYVAPILSYHPIPFNHGRIPYNNHHNFVPHPYSQGPPSMSYPPPRPLSPLNLNAEVLSTITMAPLSPRSAAFVLQNREIVERRKKSPRRSFSRSPSPRFRHSKSPRRSPSPRRYPRSLSPKKLSPSRRTVRLSPRRNSPPRLARRSSTEKKGSPKPKIASPKAPVKDRLGHRQSKQEEIKRKRTPSPDNSNKQVKSNVEENLTNTVLEARRRKFKDQVVAKEEGVIRLKPKVEEDKNGEERLQDEDTLDLNLTDTNMDDIFSDDESDDENEGRFKSSTAINRNVSVLPFVQLVNGPKHEIKNKPLEETCRDHNNLRHNRSDRDRRRSDRRKRTPTPKNDRVAASKKVTVRNRVNIKKECIEKMRVTSPIENKKIEIKIRNPAKYETSSNYDVITEDEANKKKNSRKVAVAKENEDITKDEVKVIEVNEDVSRRNEGDLRAQLSRKRAERQHHKLPVPEDVQSRLIQNALEGAVFKKNKKAKRKEKEAAPIEIVVAAKKEIDNAFNNIGMKPVRKMFFGRERRVHVLYSDCNGICLKQKDKLPIHLRLGHNDSKIYMDLKKKKSKSRSSEQV